MSVFSPKEIEHLRGQRLGRLATVNSMGEPLVVSVGFRHNAAGRQKSEGSGAV